MADYPDSADADDVIAFKYNRQGEVTELKDQNGTIHTYDFDKLGRQTQDRVTTLGTDAKPRSTAKSTFAKRPTTTTSTG